MSSSGHTFPVVFTLPLILPVYTGTGLRRRPSIKPKIFWNKFLDTATSANWNVTYRPWLTTNEFVFMGYCIGGCFAGTLLERAPERIAAAVFCQTVGHFPEDPDVMYRSGRDSWAPELLAQRPDLKEEDIEPYLHNLYRMNPDFLYSVPRDFMRNCQTPILVLPDDIPACLTSAPMGQISAIA